jgi:hypothetical protein
MIPTETENYFSEKDLIKQLQILIQDEQEGRYDQDFKRFYSDLYERDYDMKPTNDDKIKLYQYQYLVARLIDFVARKNSYITDMEKQVKKLPRETTSENMMTNSDKARLERLQRDLYDSREQIIKDRKRVSDEREERLHQREKQLTKKHRYRDELKLKLWLLFNPITNGIIIVVCGGTETNGGFSLFAFLFFVWCGYGGLMFLQKVRNIFSKAW